MSIYSALTVGTTGLQAQSNKIGILSTNLANTSTVGYKAAVANFADMVDTNSASGYTPGGVINDNSQLNDLQGDITATTSPTDLAISGNGFFAVTQTADSISNLLYTRAGSFTPDANGNLVNGAGFYLQGWPLDANGALPGTVSGTSVASGAAIANLQTVNIRQLNETPVATSTVTLQANLDVAQAAYAGPPAYDPANPAANMASGAVAPQFNTPVTVIDSTGATHNLNVAFLKTATNTWAVEVYAQPASDVTGAANGQVAAGTLTFNGDGSLASISPSLSQPVAVNWKNGAAASSLAVDWGTAGAIFGTPGATAIGKTDGLSQNAGASALVNVEQNGVQPGALTGVSISSGGIVTASYSNGSTQNFYKIPLANFTDANQLETLSGNVFMQTSGAGTASFFQPGGSSDATLESDSLESSNVDESTQLTSLVVAQQAYQFNTKLISTSDAMLQTLTQMGTT